MFRLKDRTTIEMHQGNTGTLRIHLVGYSFGNNDRVLFTMRTMKGVKVKEAICEIQDNYIEVPFVNSDTDQLEPGQYKWAVTAATDPVYDEGVIVDGSGICTPRDDMYIVIKKTAALI